MNGKVCCCLISVPILLESLPVHCGLFHCSTVSLCRPWRSFIDWWICGSLFSGMYVVIAWLAAFVSFRTSAILKDCVWLKSCFSCVSCFKFSIRVGCVSS